MASVKDAEKIAKKLLRDTEKLARKNLKDSGSKLEEHQKKCKLCKGKDRDEWCEKGSRLHKTKEEYEKKVHGIVLEQREPLPRSRDRL